MILAHIIQPTRGNSNSETPIDNIFASILSLNFILVDSTATISDHIPQFTSLLAFYLTYQKIFVKKICITLSKKINLFFHLFLYLSVD